MLVLRCTRRLATRLGIKLEQTALESTTKLGDWYANVIETPAELVVCVNGVSRLAVVIPALDADEVLAQFRARLGGLLLELGVDDAAVHSEVDATEPVVFAPTNDRKVVGSMNDICFQVAWWLTDHGPMFRESELFALEMQLSRTPHVKLREPFADRAVRARFGCVATDHVVHRGRPTRAPEGGR